MIPLCPDDITAVHSFFLLSSVQWNLVVKGMLASFYVIHISYLFLFWLHFFHVKEKLHAYTAMPLKKLNEREKNSLESQKNRLVSFSFVCAIWTITSGVWAYALSQLCNRGHKIWFKTIFKRIKLSRFGDFSLSVSSCSLWRIRCMSVFSIFHASA